MLPLASFYPASTRLAVALIVFAAFIGVTPRPSPRPLAKAVLGVIVAGWLFGATLIWGTAGPSKLRWGLDLSRWEEAVLLLVAVVGVLAAGAALRWFAEEQRRAGWIATVVFGVAYGGWSLVVRYSAFVAVLVLAAGVGALVFASRPPSPTATPAAGKASASQSSRRLWSIAANAMPLLSGVGFFFWLEWSPKNGIDQQCGLPRWLPLTLILFVGVPGLTAAIKSQKTGRSREAAAAAVVVAVAVTVGLGLVAFLAWFGANQCGE